MKILVVTRVLDEKDEMGNNKTEEIFVNPHSWSSITSSGKERTTFIAEGEKSHNLLFDVKLADGSIVNDVVYISEEEYDGNIHHSLATELGWKGDFED